jgi:hypothetical protein
MPILLSSDNVNPGAAGVKGVTKTPAAFWAVDTPGRGSGRKAARVLHPQEVTLALLPLKKYQEVNLNR